MTILEILSEVAEQIDQDQTLSEENRSQLLSVVKAVADEPTIDNMKLLKSTLETMSSLAKAMALLQEMDSISTPSFNAE